MKSAHILIGGPICQESAILKEYLLSLKNLETMDLRTDFLFIDDNTEEESKTMLKEFNIKGCRTDILDMRNSHKYIRTDVTHKWEEEQIRKVAEYRNNILEWAKRENYNYLFLADSDLLFHPLTLLHLIDQDKDIISEIFWTSWAPGGKEFPQVWLYDHYTLDETDGTQVLSENSAASRTQDFIGKLRKPGVYKVGGLGACTLISSKALNSGISFSKLPNINFRGEDRHFCIRAAVLGFELYVDTHYPAYHIYRKAELSGAQEYKSRCGYKYQS